MAARLAEGLPTEFEVSDTAVHDLDTDRPRITYRRRRRVASSRWSATRSPAATASTASAATPLPAGRATDLGADLSLRLARHPGRGRAVDRRADLRLAPGRLRAAQHAIADGEPALPAGRPGRGHRRLVGRPDLDRPCRPGSPTTAGSCRPGRSLEKSVLPMRSFVLDADAPGPALPGRRRRAHRAADRRQGSEPGHRRRPRDWPPPWSRWCRTAGPSWPTPTPTLRCNGSGAARTSPGG